VRAVMIWSLSRTLIDVSTTININSPIFGESDPIYREIALKISHDGCALDTFREKAIVCRRLCG
jgi:kynurenine formamidase